MATTTEILKFKISCGSIIEIDQHPSGIRFDGPAVVVKAYYSNGNRVVEAVSFSDPANRNVVRILNPKA